MTAPTPLPAVPGHAVTTPSPTRKLPGFNVLLEGPSGTGKTHAIGTLIETGLEVFYLALESGMESLFGYFADKGRDLPPNFHYHTLKAPETSFLDLVDNARKINTLNLESLSKMSDPKRSTYDQFISLFEALSNFPDDATGQKHGPVDSWGTDRVLVIDGLTGINNAAMALVVGGKPVRSLADWGVAQQQVETLLRKLCDSCRCHFVLLAHVERETDPVLGGSRIMTSTLGQKLAPKIPAMFSDVVLTVREGSKWSWDTSNALADLKTRNLPIQNNIPPDFKQIVDKWRKRAEG